MRPKVLVTEPIHQKGWDLLTGEVEAVPWKGQMAEPLEMALDGVQGVIVRVARLPGETIRGATQLRIVAKHGVGYDNIDVSAATACGVIVTNTPTANSQSVAEHALTLLLAVARRIGESCRDIALGSMRPQKVYQGIELSGKVLGIVGLGSSGLRLATMATRGFDMRVIGFDPYKDPWPDGIERARDVGALLTEADFVSIHVPLAKETRNLLGQAALARMKPTAVLVNTARGGIVDEAALGAAIRSGRLAGAGLDVLVDEPLKPDHPLAGIPNVILTPHVAGVTEEGMINMAVTAAEDVLRVLRGESPKYPVNPHVLAQRGSR
jgi:D-3-phosphoglycerate dehydrogenase